MKNINKFCLPLFAIITLAACSGSSTNTTSDTLTKGLDSMPVVKPVIADSAGTIITPPVNDQNNIVPDTAIKR